MSGAMRRPRRGRKEAAMLTRRSVLFGGSAMLLGGSAMALFSKPSAAGEAAFEVTHPEAEWRKRLTPAQYRVLREHGTERAGSSPLNHEKRAGTFHCAGCDLALFRSEDKFESGTGWPSFTRPIEGAVGTSEDRSWFMTRTEVHCRRCGGDPRHGFDDGPPPTGLRHCMNGVALNFV